MTNEQALLTIADALEEAAKMVRRAVAAAASPQPTEAADDWQRVLNRAREIHWQLGLRQVQGLEQLYRAWPDWLFTSDIRDLLNYDDVGTSQMLKALVKYELAERDKSGPPYRYRLGPALREA